MQENDYQQWMDLGAEFQIKKHLFEGHLSMIADAKLRITKQLIGGIFSVTDMQSATKTYDLIPNFPIVVTFITKKHKTIPVGDLFTIEISKEDYFDNYDENVKKWEAEYFAKNPKSNLKKV